MIQYTLTGPTYELEIHDQEIRLVKKPWLKVFSRKELMHTWKISELSQFEVAVPKFMMISGKLQWSTFSGEKGTYRFSTNPLMVKKIETYLQKRVIKNYEAQNNIVNIPAKKVDFSAMEKIERKKKKRKEAA